MTNSYTSIADQYHYEYLTWKRILEFFKRENSFLKTRLSEVLDNKTGKDFLALAEHFQNEFIVKDEFINDLYTDVEQLEKLLQEISITNKNNLGTKIETRHNKLRNEMEYLEKSFIQLKNEFNRYVVSIL